jgi:thiamine transporter
MVPIIWLALRRGIKIGVTAAVVYGFIQFALLPYVAPTPYAAIQVMLDYPLAFGVLGLAGLFRKYPLAGASIGIVGRFIMHFVSGVLFWAATYAPESDPYLYSAVYNGSYILPELAITMVIIFFLENSKALDIYL